MSTLSTRLRGTQDRLIDLLAGMTPRDRTLLLTLVGFTILAVVGGGMWWMNRTVSGYESRIADLEGRLHQVQVLQGEHEEAKVEVDRIREALQANADTDLAAFLEQAAARSSISEKLSQVRPKSTANDGVVEEKIYDVSLKDLSLEELSGFLYEIETSKYPMRIRTFKVKRRQKAGEKVLNVDMDIASYRVSEEVDGGEG